MNRPSSGAAGPLETKVLRLLPVVLVVLGAFGGLGLFTFHYGEGLSYLSSDPLACVNCHIMRPQYDSWSKAGHRHVAVCVDCHLPAPLVPKLYAKADNGWRHSKAFTLQNFPEPIRITPGNAAILQDNCLRCHADLVAGIAWSGRHGDAATACVHCHRTVGHGP